MDKEIIERKKFAASQNIWLIAMVCLSFANFFFTTYVYTKYFQLYQRVNSIDDKVELLTGLQFAEQSSQVLVEWPNKVYDNAHDSDTAQYSAAKSTGAQNGQKGDTGEGGDGDFTSQEVGKPRKARQWWGVPGPKGDKGEPCDLFGGTGGSDYDVLPFIYKGENPTDLKTPTGQEVKIMPGEPLKLLRLNGKRGPPGPPGAPGPMGLPGVCTCPVNNLLDKVGLGVHTPLTEAPVLINSWHIPRLPENIVGPRPPIPQN